MKTIKHAGRAGALLVSVCAAAAAVAGTTDLSNVPLWSSVTSNVKPNVLFVLDDSGSMGDNFLPDDAGGFRSRTVTDGYTISFAQFGRSSAQCNGLAYNPETTYKLPVDHAGVEAADATTTDINNLLLQGNVDYTAYPRSVSLETSAVSAGSLTVKVTAGAASGAFVNGMAVTVYDYGATGRYMVGTVTSWNSSTSLLTINVVLDRGAGVLGTPVVAYGTPGNQLYYQYTGTQPRMGYSYPVSAVDTTTLFYRECASKITDDPGRSVFSARIMTPSSPDAKNYWRWATYYYSRMAMMKTAVSQAFKPFNDKYRIGYTTISSQTVAEGGKMLHVRDFDSTQKQSFYTKLFAATPGGYTPLRGAVMKAGRYFAKMMPSQDYDPVQYSCQKNFLILSTDGYWNTYNESSSYGPYSIDGSATVGNMDGVPTPRPMFDGGVETTTVSKTWNVTNTFQRTTKTPINYKEVSSYTETEQRYSYSLVTDKSNCPASPYTRILRSTDQRSVTYSQDMTQTLSTVVKDMQQVLGYQQDTATVKDGSTTTTTAGDPYVKTTGALSTLKTYPTVYETTTGDWYVSASTSWKSKSTTKLACATTAPDTSAASVVATSSTTVSKTGSRTTATGPVTTLDGDVTSVAGTPTTSTSTNTAGGASNTLADVAMYYYKTDLRSDDLDNCTGSKGLDVCANNVKPLGDDDATWQHMTTYTLSLGNSGTLKYDRDYKTKSTGDFAAIKAGARNWPNPATEGATRIDDLWHAAVNGRGTYFNAQDPSSLSSSLAAALSDITRVSGTAAAAATSTLQPTSGDNGVYISQFTSPDWTGDLRKYTFNADGSYTVRVYDDASGSYKDAATWSAAAKLTPETTRTIKFFRPGGSGATGSLVNFDAASMLPTELALFQNVCSKAAADRLSQCDGADATSLASLNSASTMVSYLRGQPQTAYRLRKQVLGDLVNSAPVFVGPRKFKYTENGYDTWAASKSAASSTRILLVGGNDGMLHAFKDEDGSEAWAYVPSLVMSDLYRLADANYSSKHRYYVDGSVVVGDIYVDGAWKTIAVGGLNGGGRGYYALDVTDTLNPKALWEISPNSLPADKASHLGLTYGNPIITKNKAGTWIVAFSSGYNNPDGGGYLFIVNANTGELLKEIATGAGTASTPSGLGKINAWVETLGENKALRFYGGDMLGNLWRFDHDDLVEPKGGALRIAQFLYGASKTPQPITTKPMLAEFEANGATRRVVYVGTGRYLGASDVAAEADSQQQSIYGVVDEMTSTGLGDVRGPGILVKQAIDTTTSPRTVGGSATPVDWSKDKGWYVDLASKAERISVDMLLAANTLVGVGNVPGVISTACEPPGSNSAYLYMFNIISGSGKAYGLTSMLAGLGVIQLESGKLMTVETDTTGPDGGGSEKIGHEIDPVGSGAGAVRRTSWRELH